MEFIGNMKHFTHVGEDKHMFYYKLIISVIILYQSCEIESNRRVPLVFQNNTEYSVITFFNDNYEDYKDLYPDTNISALIV